VSNLAGRGRIRCQRAGERHLAQELRGVGLAGFEQPKWKTAALGKAPTYGISDARSIKDQRESLPIFRLRDQLLQAIHDHQVSDWFCPQF